MPLSEYERQVLADLERQLASDDPKLANTFQAKPAFNAKKVLLAVVGIALGLGVLIVGVATELLIVGVAGFLIMFAAVSYAFLSKTPGANTSQGAPEHRSYSGTPKSGNSLMDGLEERWQKRWEEDR